MSKKTRRVLMLGVGLLGIGIIMALIGIAFGGSTTFITKEFWKNPIECMVGGYERISDENKGILETSNNNISDKTFFGKQVEKASLEPFSEIQAEIGCLKFNVRTSDSFFIDIKNDSNRKITYSVEDGELRIKQQEPYMGITNVKGFVDVYVPKEWKLDRLEINNGVGEVEIEDIDVAQLVISMGVGELELVDTTIGKLDIEGGVGSISATGIVCDETDVRVGVGEVSLEGDLKGDINIEGGMGVVEVITTRRYEDYNYHITKGLGNIEVNGRNASVFEDVEENNGAPYTMTIEGGIGAIEVETN